MAAGGPNLTKQPSTTNSLETISFDVDTDIIQNLNFQQFIKGLEGSQHVLINMNEFYGMITITGKKTAIEFSKKEIENRIVKMNNNTVKGIIKPLKGPEPTASNEYYTIELSVAENNFLELFGEKISDTIRKTTRINNVSLEHGKLQLYGDIHVVEMIQSYLEQTLHVENIQITVGMKQHLELTNHGRLLKEFLQKYRVGSSLQGFNRGDKNNDGHGRGNKIRGGHGSGNDIRGGRGSWNEIRGGHGSGNDIRGGRGSGNEIRGGRGSGNDIRGGRGSWDEIRGGRGSGNDIRGGRGSWDGIRGGRGSGNDIRGGRGSWDEIRGGRGRSHGNRGPRERGDFSAYHSSSNTVENLTRLNLNTANTHSSQKIFDNYKENENDPDEDDDAQGNSDDNDDNKSEASNSDLPLLSVRTDHFEENTKKLITITLCSDSKDSLSKAVAELRNYSFCTEHWALKDDEITFILKQEQRDKPQQTNNSISDRSSRIKSYLVQFVNDHSVHVFIAYVRGIWYVRLNGSKQRVQSAIFKMKSYLNDVIETEVQIPISKAMASFLGKKALVNISKLEKKHSIKITIFPPPYRKKQNEDNNDDQENVNNCLKLVGSISRVNSAQEEVENFLGNLLEREQNFPYNSWDLATKISTRIIPCFTKIYRSNDYESIGYMKFYNSPIQRRETTPKITYTIVSLDEETMDDVIQQCTDIIEGYVVWELSVQEYRAIWNILMVQKSPSIKAFQQEWDTDIQLDRDTNTITIPARSKMIADEIKEALQNLSKGRVSVKKISEVIPIPRKIHRFVYQAIKPVLDEAKAQRVYINSKNCNELTLHGFANIVTPMKEKINSIVKDFIQQIITHRLILPSAESELMRTNSYEIIKRIEQETNTVIRDVKVDADHSKSNENNEDITLTMTSVANNRDQTILVKKGDIIKAQDVDAIVNAANGTLQHAGGVAKIINNAVGPTLDQECKQLIAQNRGVAIATGTAVKTTAGNLPFKSIIHAIGPQYEGGNKQERPLLFSSVLSSLRLAEKEGYTSIAVPAISAVTYRFPLQDCTTIVIRAVKQFFADFPQSSLRKVILLDIDDSVCNSFAREVINDHTNAVDNDILNYEVPPPLTSKWCWQDDYDEKIYDENHTRQIENAFQQYLQTVIAPTLTVGVDNLKTGIITNYSIHFLPNLKQTLAANPNAQNARIICGHQMQVDSHYKRNIIRYPLVQPGRATPAAVYRPKPIDTYQLQILILDVDWDIITTTKQAIQQAETRIREAIEAATISELFSVNLNQDIETHKRAIRKIAIQQSVQVDFQQDSGGRLPVILKGLKQNVLQVQLKISLYAQDILKIELDKDDQLGTPREWDEQEEQCKLVEIPKTHPDFIRIENRMKETMNNVKIDQIQRVQHLRLWNRYAFNRRDLQQKLNDKPNLQIEMELFHGTRNTPPSQIYDGEHGFDTTFCSAGLWGIGAYFAKNASYSCPRYSHSLPNGKKQVFLVQVLTGDAYDYKQKTDSTLRRPPMKSERTSYDSVSGETGGSQVYIVYYPNLAYPAFLITYKL